METFCFQGAVLGSGEFPKEQERSQVFLVFWNVSPQPAGLQCPSCEPQDLAKHGSGVGLASWGGLWGGCIGHRRVRRGHGASGRVREESPLLLDALSSCGKGHGGGVAAATAPVTGAALESSSGLVWRPDRASAVQSPRASEGASGFLPPEGEGSGPECEAVRCGHPLPLGGQLPTGAPGNSSEAARS